MTRFAGVAALALAAVLFLPGRLEAACTITTTDLNFGAYDVFATSPADSVGAVRYRCTGNTPSFTISLGTGSSGTFNPRRMVFGAERLGYNLYLDAAHTSIWGDGTAGTSWFMAVAPDSKATNVTIFGRIPPGQDVAAGSYSDAIVVTIQF
jgi:spore coat protein U-like protein